MIRVRKPDPIPLGGAVRQSANFEPAFEVEPTTDPTTQRMCDETGHQCIACPSDVRNIAAVLHNLVNALEAARQDGDFFRVWKKLRDARAAVDAWQPIVDGHFAALNAWRRP